MAKCSGRRPMTTSSPSCGGRCERVGIKRRSRSGRCEGRLHLAVGTWSRGVDHVHGRRADEAGDEEVGGPLVDLVGRADLLDHAAVHHRDLGGHGHGLDLVVGDVDDRGLELVVEPLDLEPHLGAELGIEVGERLVEEEDADVLDERPADGDALALAARELRAACARAGLDLQELCRPGDAPVDLGAVEASAPRART